LAIYCVKKHNFNNILYRIIVRVIQVTIIVTLPISFLVSTKMFRSFGIGEYYETVGIDSIFNISQGLKPAAYFITQTSLFLYSCILNRLFEYQRLNQIAIEKIDKYSMSVGEIIGDNIIEHNVTF